MMKLLFATAMLACLGACVSKATTDSASTAPVKSVAAAQGDNVFQGDDGTNYKVVRTVKVAGDPNEMICRVDNITGSRVKKHKVCLTRAEWAELSAANEKDTFDRTVSGGTAYQ